ncbi:MAG: FtsX-like permease family protein [Chitinophagaceae bacterium]
MMTWRFALRYFFAKKSTHAINIISWVSIGAIATGTAALIIVLSVFNGFEDLVKSLYSSFYPQIKVTPYYGKTFLVPAQQLKDLQGISAIESITEVAQEKAILRYNKQQTIAVLKGVDKHYPITSGLPGKIIRGHYGTGDSTQPEAVVGEGIESALGIDVRRSFIPISAYIPNRRAHTLLDPEDALHMGSIDPVGTFAIQQDFDNKYVITNIDFMRSMLDMAPDEVSALEISLKNPEKMTQVQARIRQLLGKNVLVRTRYEQNSGLYNIMETEKWAVYAILSFILIIAAFNMIGSLSMLVMEKQRDISILKAMGTQEWTIRKIFLLEGMMIAGSGTLMGTLLAITVCELQKKYGWVKLQGGSFVVDSYPVSMHPQDFLLVVVTILVIALLASWFPALKASWQSIDLKS